MISCLMVTQALRLPLARLAIGDFSAQTHADRELVIVHDGDATLDADLRRHAAASVAPVLVHRHRSGCSLGTLRNAARDAARGDFVCQWDDDDRSHPERLALQWEALRSTRADFCFLADQLHWFPACAEMYWDDWNREAYPMNLVQGTLLGRRALLPEYPDLPRGEDTPVVRETLRRGHAVTRLRDAGWCHVYVYHGANAWDAAHHLAISRAKRYGQVRLLQRAATLRVRLAQYTPGFGALRFPHEGGALEL